jgi:hypothetical protein
MTDLEALTARIDRLEKALMTALVWLAGNNPPTVSNAELCAIDKIVRGE